MLRIACFLFVSLCCAALFGCATIFNGSTQDVRVIMPEGTKITDDFGGDLPISYYRNGRAILKLKRKNDYTLRFTYKGQEAKSFLSGSLEPGWIVADFILYYVAYIVDGISGDWFAFDDPIYVHFPGDSTQSEKITTPTVEINDEPSSPSTGIVVSGKVAMVFPMSGFGGSYGLSVGYKAFPRFIFLLGYEGGSGVDILPANSYYYTNSTFSHINLECRVKALNSLYLTGGGGWSNISSDSLATDRYVYNDTTGYTSKRTIYTTPINKWMPTLFLGIGIAGRSTFFELRHTFGLSKIYLPNGDIGKFETTTLTFGLNLDF